MAHNNLWAAAICVVAALQATLICTHEPWLDEVQALLISWQSPDFAALLKNLSYEAHPPLWYLLLDGVAHVVPFAWVLRATALGMALLIQALILGKAPFSRGERLLMALSEFTLVEFGTISRSLALGALIFLACAAFWRHRSVWVLIALLPMCDFLFGVLSAILVLLRIRQGKVWLPGLCLWLVLSALAAWTVIPAPGMAPADAPLAISLEATKFAHVFGGVGLPFQTLDGRVTWNGVPPLQIGSFLSVVLVCWFWQRTASDRMERAVLIGYVAFCLIFSLSVYSLYLRHLSTVALLLIVLTWIQPQRSPREQVRWRIWLIVCAVSGVASSIVLLTQPFDAAPQVAAQVERLNDGRTPWLAYPAHSVPPLRVKAPVDFVQPEQGCTVSFVRWDRINVIGRDRRNAADLEEALPRWAKRYGRSFVVLDMPPPANVSRAVYRPLTPVFEGLDRQSYVIGILAPDQPVKQRDYPPCVSGLRPLP